MRGFTIFFIYLYNKIILEYAQILVTSGRFMIFHIEGHSNIQLFTQMINFYIELIFLLFYCQFSNSKMPLRNE